MPVQITSIMQMPEGKRWVSHYVKYCATNGELAEAHLIGRDGVLYCVCCPSELNQAGQRIANKHNSKE